MIYLLCKLNNGGHNMDSIVIGAFQTLTELRRYTASTQLEFGYDWAYTDMTIGSPRENGFYWRKV